MNAQSFIGTTAIGVAALLGGCGSTSDARSEPATATTAAPAQGPRMGMMGGVCPMQVPGTTVTSEDVEGGVALVFTTSKGDVAALRQRVRSMAEMHNQHHAAGGMMMGGMMMPAATASVEDIEGGARLVLRPKDPAQLDALREHTRMRAGRMAHGECPMMSPSSTTK